MLKRTGLKGRPVTSIKVDFPETPAYVVIDLFIPDQFHALMTCRQCVVSLLVKGGPFKPNLLMFS